MTDSPATFLQWGVLQISLPNLIVLIVMVILFVLAVTVPFPHSADAAPGHGGSDDLAR